jgi:FkbM family methyltransferase
MREFLRKYPAVKAFLKKIRHLLRSASPTYRLRGKLTAEVSVALPKLTCIDVGASYYPHPQWEIFRKSAHTEWVAVEPNSDNLFYLKQWNWPSVPKAINTGVSEQGGELTLYITNVDTGSSLLKPHIGPNMEHRILSKDYFFPLREVRINTITLETVINGLENKGPILIKLDTQGTEFSILKGLSHKSLQRVICVEFENTLLARPFMSNSAPFYEPFAYFQERGFELVYMKPIELNAPIVKKSLKSRYVLNECDAVFMLRTDLAKERGIDIQLALIGGYISYHLYGEALHMLQYLLTQKDCSTQLRAQVSSMIGLLKAHPSSL